MKKYDFEKMKQLVKDNAANGLDYMEAGMAEDWNLTTEEFWDKEEGFSGPPERGLIAGISGSSWATPVVKMYFEDGSTIVEECYTQHESNATDKEIQEMKQFAKATGGMDNVK